MGERTTAAGILEEWTLDPAKVLRNQELRLAREYGASQPPRPLLGGEDLECDDPRDARHWVRVYTELAQFMHALIEEQSPGLLDDPTPEPRSLPAGVRAMTLQARVLELHLSYWTERLRRSGGVDGSPGGGEEGGGHGP